MASAARVMFFGSEKKPPLVYEQCNVPQIKEGEVLAKILLTTLCGSDLHTISGKRSTPVPSVLGHEAVAEVIENADSSRTDISVGDRITFSITISCDQCRSCVIGLPQKCDFRFKYGHSGVGDSGFNGCYATHIVLKKNTTIVKLPDNIPNCVAAPINCALATVISAIRHIPDDDRFQTALIQGAGLLGIYACAFLKKRGFKKVYCTDISINRLLPSHKFGAIPVSKDTPGMMEPYPSSVDLVVEVCGSPKVVQDGVQVLRPGGTYLLLGMVHPDSQISITGEQIISKCLTIKGIHNYEPRDLKDAVDFISNTMTEFPYETLVAPPEPLKKLADQKFNLSSQAFHRVSLDPFL